MTAAQLREDDQRRLNVLQRYGLLDTPPEAVFDSLALAAADLCEAPIALISLVAPSRQWNKACIGLSVSELPRDAAFCAHAVKNPTAFMEVEDARADLRFSHNPLVTGESRVRFYAGQPLTTSNGFALGSLCVMDRRPRKLSAAQRDALINLAKVVVTLFEERRNWPLSAIGEVIENNLYAGILLTDASRPDNPISYCNRGFERITGYSRSEIIGRNCRFLQGQDSDPDAIRQMRDAVKNRRECTVTMKNYRKDGTAFWNELTIAPVWDEAGNASHFLGIQSDITETRLKDERFAAVGSVLEASSNEIYMFDQASLHFVHINQGAQQNLGYSMKELSLMTPVDIKPEFTVESFKAMLGPLSNGEGSKIEFTTEHMRADGSTYPVEVHLQRAEFDGRPVFVAIVLDISRRTEAEKSLAQARLFLDLAPDATVIANEAGLIQVFNSHTARLFGYRHDELRGMPVENLMPERFRHKHIGHRAAYGTNPAVRGMGANFGLLGLTKDGREFPIEVSLSPIQFENELLIAASVRDVSERQQVEAALRESEARYRDLFDNANDLIQSVGPDGSLLYVNAAWREALGYSEQEIENLRITDVIHPDNLAHCEAIFRRVIQGESVEHIEANFVTRDGATLCVEGSVSCGKQTGKPVSTRAIFHNVTQRKQAEAALKRAKEVAERATEAKSRFLAAASHDLRQPLQSLGLYLSVMNRLTSEPGLLEISGKMRNSLDVMGDLLDVLLDISKLDSGAIVPEKKDFSVQSLFDALMAAGEPDASKKGLTLRCAATHCIVHSDPVLLQRIVANFLGNGIRYTEQGSVELRCNRQGDVVRIEVVDSGVGIPEEALESIFEEYFQLDNPVRDRRRGLGLGLSIVKHIARLLDHPLSVESVPGKGSTFAVDVPAGKPQQPAAAPRETARGQSTGKRKTRVLFIDDDPAIVDATTLLLSVSGFEVLVAYDGEQALEHIREGARPDVVVSDYRLPGLNGIEVIRKVREAIFPDIPCVLMTGDTSAREIELARPDNCTVLHKPVDTDRLVGLIGGAARRSE